MTYYSDTLRESETQRPIPGAKIYVYDEAGVLDTLTDNLGAALTNPLTSDEFGNFSFNASDGKKTLDIFYGVNRIWKEVALVGAVPTTFVNNAMAIGLFTAAAALTIPGGTDRVQTSGYASAGRGAADYLYDPAVDSAYVAAHPRASFISANGRGFRLDPTRGISIDHVGAVPDCTAIGTGTDNAAAINAAISYAALTGKGAEIIIPRNILGYRVASTLTFTGGVKIRGQGFSQSPTGGLPTAIKGSLLVFDANVGGLKFFAFTDNNANATVNEFESSVFSVLEDIYLCGGGGTTVTAHGIETRTCLHARNVWSTNFAGEGLHVEATTAALAVPYGNANRSKFDHCFFTGNGCHGAHLKGTDANAIMFSVCEFSTNGGLGVLDETGIGGNAYVGCVFELNNVSYGAATPQRTQVLADFAGLSDQMFGSIAFTSSTVAHSCLHCYNETGGTGMKAHLPEGVGVFGSLLARSTSWDSTSQPNGIDGFNSYAYLGGIKAKGSGGTLTVDPQLVFNRDLGFGGVGTDARINWSSNDGFVMGGNGATNDWKFFNKNAGTVMYNPTGTQNVRFGGSILSTSATGGIGYLNGVGAGGSATQGTSRSTGVAVNNISGTITLFSTTTTAGQKDSFTLTNSALGPNDTITFTQLTGAGFYIVNAKNNGNGTATVNVYTPIAVGSAEAPQFQFNIVKGANS